MGWNERSDPDMRTANFCDVYREGVYKVFRDNYSQLGRTSPNGLGFKAAIFSSGVGTFWL